MEQTPQGAIRPFLSFPPLAVLALLFVFRHGLYGNLEVDDGEQKLAPRNQTFRALLVLAEVHDDAGLVCLQNEMQHRRDLLRGAWRRLDHLRSNADEGGEYFNHDLR